MYKVNTISFFGPFLMDEKASTYPLSVDNRVGGGGGGGGGGEDVPF